MNLPTISGSRTDARVSTKKIGEILIERGLVTEEDVKAALEQAKKSGSRIGEVLINKKRVSTEDITLALSAQLNVPIVDLRQLEIDNEALKIIPEDIARKSVILPLATDEKTLVIAMAYPDDIRTIRDLTTKTGKRLQIALASSTDINNTIDLYYRSQQELEQNISQLAPVGESEITVASEFVAETPIAQSLELILRQAIRDRASDVHIEPQEKRLRIRYRIDGILHDMYSLPISSHSALISRIKILSEMNIAEQRRPQDGQYGLLRCLLLMESEVPYVFWINLFP
jgi:type IV pilus assembly protein PilB